MKTSSLVTGTYLISPGSSVGTIFPFGNVSYLIIPSADSPITTTLPEASINFFVKIFPLK